MESPVQNTICFTNQTFLSIKHKNLFFCITLSSNSNIKKHVYEKNPYKEAPANFSVCVHTDCTCGSTCLRQLAYPVLLEREAFLHLANPTRCTKDHSCPYYRDAAPVTYMRGFTQMKKRMYPEQYQMFMNFLIARFGRNPYFERRRGDRKLSLQEQEIIRKALKQAGVTENLDFDLKEEGFNWFD